MWKSHNRPFVSSHARFFILLTAAFLLCALCGFVLPLTFRPQMLPDQVMVDVPQVLKSSQWKPGTDNTVRDEDIRGVWMADVASRERSTANIQSEYVNLIQDV